MKFQQFNQILFKILIMLMATGGFLLTNAPNTFAQFTFAGDFDRSNFASPLGYFVEPQNNFPLDPINPARASYIFTGELNPDGSIIGGGRRENSYGGDFWLRKFTASGAPDTSFGGGTGYVRTVFETDFFNAGQNSLPAVLKRQADGKIVFGGICQIGQQTAQNSSPGTDFCLVRYNADGSIDTSFGGYSFVYGAANQQFTHNLPPGRVWIKSGLNDNNSIFGDFSELRDMEIQPDGKIIVVGYARALLNPNQTGRDDGVIVRFNSNGTLDTSFGLNGSGIARFIPPNAGTTSSPCYQARQFYAIRLQPDGRIIAVGRDGGSSSSPCDASAAFFVVTRWTANGTLETIRRLDSSTNQFTRERAVSALITNDGGKLLVSGLYQGRLALTRFNLSDLTLDASFGTNGVKTYNLAAGQALNIQAIQQDGKILSFDGATNYPISRLNPDGSPDNSFGNQIFDFQDPNNPRGRADLPVFTVNNTAQISVGHILLRPNGKFNVIGAGLANFGGPNARALVSQNIASPHNGVNSDFDGDGKTDLSIFRPGPGEWWYLKSSNGANAALQFGAGTDKITPGDFTGDGKTDFAFFRPSTGSWFVLRSEDYSFYSFPFGTTNDVPTPGDFDGDGKADAAVFRPSTLTWYINRSSGGTTITTFGAAGDVPVATDYDGDGLTDIAIYRPSLGQWWIQRSSTGVTYALSFGSSTDKTVAGDYTGDGKSDVALFRPSTGSWFILRSEDNSFYSFPFGASTDVPSPGDYDGDGKFDATVFRPSTSTWYSNRSTAGVLIQAFGSAGDIPVPNAYVR